MAKHKRGTGKHEGPRKKEPSAPGKHIRRPVEPDNCFACDVMMHKACVKDATCKCYQNNKGAHQ